jgi:beta-phosphoglucomutase-like phosphatase (HAD superfamily)
VIATLFDFDGVLVDSEPVHLAAFNDVLAPRGIVISERDYAARFLSLDDAGVFRTVLSHSGSTLREEEVRALVAAKSPRFMARFEQAFRVFPGAVELLSRRARRGPIGIVSGALEREIGFALEKMGVRGEVAFVVSADSGAASKPDPAPYQLAMAKLLALGGHGHGHVAAAVAIEDSLGGVTSAKRAGLRCVAVAHSYSGADLQRAGADAIAADLAGLTDAILDGGE